MKSTLRFVTGFLLALLFRSPLLHAAEIFTNGSFELNSAGAGARALPAGWTFQASVPSAAMQVSNAQAQAGAWSLRVTGRGDPLDGPRQSITAALSASGSGVRRRSRCWLRLDDGASVRVLLRFDDDDGHHPDVILAEQVVRTPNQWVLVEGSSVIAWTGTLKSASVRLEVVQLSRTAAALPARLLPDYFVDGFSMDADADNDGMMDRDEAASGFSAAKADTDGDRLPDRWEKDHGFSPTVAEGLLDTDGDGFSNVQEYWAATDPRDARSYPGRPANPKMNSTAQSVLRWLALLPSQAPGRHLAVGQSVSDLGSATEYPAMIDRLGTTTGRYPAILSMAIEPPFDRFGIPLQVDAAESRALTFWLAGGLVLFKWAMYNPWTGKNGNDQTGVDVAGLVNPASSASSAKAANQAAHDRLVGWMSTVADSLERLQQQGVAVLFRPCSEMNGNWFWWGLRERAEYIALWRFVYGYFTTTRGLNNLIWVYEGDAGTHAPVFNGAGSAASDYYYPGDDWVDVMGHNLYSATWAPAFNANEVYRRYPKVYGIPQAGPDKASRNGAFDNLLYLTQSEAVLPRSSFFIVWNSFNGTDPVTQQQAYSHIAIADNINATALMLHPSVVTRESLPGSWLFGPSPVITPPPTIPPPPPVIAPPTITARLSNLSVRAAMTAGRPIIVGFSVSAGGRSILLRGVGPALVNFGLDSPMANPRLAVYDAGTLIAQNDDWGNSAALSATFASVGAFALPANSRDAALVQAVAGERSVHLEGSGTGVALVELYDTGTEFSPRLNNVSARNHVGAAAEVLICGFVVQGSGTINVLIRAVGPKLIDFGLGGVLADPKLDVFRSGSATAMASNDNWDSALATTFGPVGAFALTPGSRDAALVISLAPGDYTVLVTGVNGGTGEALAEIYEVP